MLEGWGTDVWRTDGGEGAWTDVWKAGRDAVVD